MNLSVITLVSTLLIVFPSVLARYPLHPHENHNYREYHSYPEGTTLDERDGWKRVFISDLPYKYSNGTSYSTDVSQLPRSDVVPLTLGKHASKRGFRTRGHSHKSKAKNKTASVKNGSKDVVKGTSIGGVLDEALKGIGKATEVVITWYTGHDLKNPSCWANSEWTPSDQSLVCALTLEGWSQRPECFSFLELCNTPEVCIFVRVVDTCAGCKRGSHHVDLTTAAFTKLAPLSVGTLSVNMRIATKPKNWYHELWGPKNNELRA